HIFCKIVVESQNEMTRFDQFQVEVGLRKGTRRVVDPREIGADGNHAAVQAKGQRQRTLCADQVLEAQPRFDRTGIIQSQEHGMQPGVECPFSRKLYPELEIWLRKQCIALLIEPGDMLIRGADEIAVEQI